MNCQDVPRNPIASLAVNAPGARTGSWLLCKRDKDCRTYSGLCGAV